MQIDPMYFLIFTIVTFVSFIIVSYFANLYFKRDEQIEKNAKEIVNSYLSFLSEKLKLHQNSVIKYIKSRTEFLEKFEEDFFENFEKMQNSQKNIQNDIENLMDKLEVYEKQFRKQNLKIIELQNMINERNGIINYKNNKIAKLQNKINALEDEIRLRRNVDGD